MYHTNDSNLDENFIKVPRSSKPRAKAVNDVLLTRRGGRMKNPKDISRSKEKQVLQRQLFTTFED